MRVQLSHAGIGAELQTRLRLAAQMLVAYRVQAQVGPWQGSGCQLVLVDMTDGHGRHVAEIAVRRQIATVAVGDPGEFAGRFAAELPADVSVSSLSNAILQLVAPERGGNAQAKASLSSDSRSQPAGRSLWGRSQRTFAWSRLTSDLATADVQATLDSRTIYLSRSEGRVRANTLSDMLFALEHVDDERWQLKRIPTPLAAGQAEISRSQDAFLLQAALCNPDAIASYPQTPFTLEHWPDLGEVSDAVDSLRVAGAMASRPMAVEQMARKLGLPKAIVNAHYWAFDAGGLLKAAESAAPAPAARRVDAGARGLWARLAAHFGIGGNPNGASG